MEENDTEVFVPKKNGTEPGLNWTSLLLLLILLTLVAFGAFYFGKKEIPSPTPSPIIPAETVLIPSPEASASASPSALPTPTSTPKASPTATPENIR